MANKKKENRFRDRIKFSIVLKLNARLFLRTLITFLILNALLFAAFAAGTVWYAETSLASAAGQIEKSGLPADDMAQWLKTQGLQITILPKPLTGFTLPASVQKVLPRATANAARSISVSGSQQSSVLSNDKLIYSIGQNYDGEPYEISLSLYGLIRLLKSGFAVLFIAEFIILLNGLFSHMRIIRKTLQPIAELARTAESLNKASGAFSQKEMEDLAGRLNDINAAKLDTRIPLESTQRELKNLAVSINNLLDRINDSYRSQIRFVSDASHELRTPIAVIQGYANLLDRWGKNDEKTMQESITAIKEEAANMKLLVEQLLFLARGDNNTMHLQLETFDLSALAKEVVGETQMIDAGHEYDSTLGPAAVHADKALIKQCMRILIDNAIKYTPSGGHIKAAVLQADGYARLSVQDDGIGIPPQAVPRIFDRFYRADESRARATGGTGLGLSIAKWIVERHGGFLEVLSRENIGTRISVTLPIAAGAPETPGADSPTD